MSPAICGATWRGDGAKTKPDRVGAERHRQQGVVLAGGAADLDEHQRRARDPAPPRSSRERRPPGRRRAPGPRRPGRRRSRRRPAVARRRRCGSPTRPPGPRRRAASGPPARPGPVSTSKVTRSRWLTPIRVAPRGERPLGLGLVVDLDQGVEPDRGGQVHEFGDLLGERAAAMSRTASAPMHLASRRRPAPR